jgi:hypothetical protein
MRARVAASWLEVSISSKPSKWPLKLQSSLPRPLGARRRLRALRTLYIGPVWRTATLALPEMSDQPRRLCVTPRPPYPIPARRAFIYRGGLADNRSFPARTCASVQENRTDFSLLCPTCPSLRSARLRQLPNTALRGERNLLPGSMCSGARASRKGDSQQEHRR